MRKNELQALLNRDEIADYLPYMAYDENSQYFLMQDSSLGFGLEINPIPYAGDAQINAIDSVINLAWPQDTVLQFILYADPFQEKILDLYDKMRDPQYVGYKQNKFIKKWTVNFCDYLKRHRNDGISNDIPVPFRNYRIFFFAKYGLKNLMDYDSENHRMNGFRDSVKGSLTGAQIYNQNMEAKELIHVLYRLMNQGKPYGRKFYNPDQNISDQIIDSESHIEVEDEYIQLNSGFARVKTPRVYSPEPSTYYTNMLLGDLITGGNQSQIPCPYMLTLNILPKSVSKAIYSKANVVMAQRAATKIAPKLERKKQEFSRVVNDMEDGRKYCSAYLTLVTFADTFEKLEQADKVIETVWSKQRFALQNEKWYQMPLFLYSLPFGPYGKVAERIGRFEYVETKAIGATAPIQADWRGTPNPAMLFISRRGQLMSFDLRDSDTNYNCFLAATSGAGKSFFTNYMIMNYLSLGGQVFCIDIGRSYEKLCKHLGGQYIEFSDESNISLNYFSTLTPDMFKKESNADTESVFIMLSRLLAQMAKPKEKITDWEFKTLQNALQEAINRMCKGDCDRLSLDSIIEILKEQSQDLEDRGLQDRRKIDLAEMLEPYSSRHTTGKWFTGEMNVKFNSNFVVLELDHLESNPDLREIVLLMLICLIDQQMYLGDRSVPKLVIIDEAWALFQGQNTGEFIERGYRRARKHGGSYVTITQSIMDFYQKGNSEVGQAIMSNSAWKFLLSQKKEDLERAKKENQLVLSDFEMTLAKNVHTIKGSYSEVFMQADNTHGIARLFVDEYSKYLFNTDPNVVEYLKNKTEQGLSLNEAIEQAMAEKIRA